MPAGHAKRVYSALLFTGQECAELRIPWENVQLEKQKSICEANFAWIFACYWNAVNSNNITRQKVEGSVWKVQIGWHFWSGHTFRR